MSQVEAIFRKGVFEPLEPVNLPDNQRVRLNIEPAPQMTMAEWIEDSKRFRDMMRAKYGEFPDSTPGIAEDRRR